MCCPPVYPCPLWLGLRLASRYLGGHRLFVVLLFTLGSVLARYLACFSVIRGTHIVCCPPVYSWLGLARYLACFSAFRGSTDCMLSPCLPLGLLSRSLLRAGASWARESLASLTSWSSLAQSLDCFLVFRGTTDLFVVPLFTSWASGLRESSNSRSCPSVDSSRDLISVSEGTTDLCVLSPWLLSSSYWRRIYHGIVWGRLDRGKSIRLI